jgi:hypothetical protein
MLVATLPLETGHSPYVVIGDVVACASVIVACAWLGIGSGLWPRVVPASSAHEARKPGQLA